MRAELESVGQIDRTPEARAARIQSMLEEVRRMSALVDSLLLLSRSDDATIQIDRQAVNLGLMLASAAEDIRLLGESSALSVELSAPETITVNADPARLRQILLNLIDNAVKFNRPNGQIRLSLETEPGRVCVTVGNTGPGLSEAHRARLFERFFRGDPSRSRVVPGFGLGLALSRELARAHGGELEFAGSNADWTEFRLTLPTHP